MTVGRTGKRTENQPYILLAMDQSSEKEIVDILFWLQAVRLQSATGRRNKTCFDVLQVTMRELTSHLSQPVEREGLTDEISASPRAEGDGGEGRRRNRKEDKYGLMDNMVIESLPPMREEGPRVFIIS